MSSAAVALALCAAPTLAQDAEAPGSSNIAIPAAPSNTSDTVGDARLRDFSLSGTVTKPAEAPSVPARQQTATERPAAASADPVPAASDTSSVPAPQRTADASRRGPERTAPATTAQPSASAFSFGPPTPASGTSASLSPETFGAQPASAPEAAPIAAQSVDGSGWMSLMPWLAALLAAIGAAAWYFRRQRSGYAFAGAGGDASTFDLRPAPAPPVRPAQPRAQPAPRPLPRAPAPPPASTPAPAPTPPVSTGVVSTRLRPWLDIQFAPDRIEIGEQRATLHFMIEVFNSGSAPARDVLVEAVLFNAGPDQDEAIARFFDKPAGEGERIPAIAPLQRMNFQTKVSVPREQMRIFEAGGRKVFVPLIGFNAYYRWGSGEGQTSVSFLLGRDTAGEKMSPFRVDIGPRTFRGLGAREHTLRVRK